jgi:hypothetical protein
METIVEQLQRFGSILETSIVLSRLEELPGDPHPPRAIADLEVIYGLIERLRRWVGDDLRPVLGKAERKLRQTAHLLRAHLPIHGDE